MPLGVLEFPEVLRDQSSVVMASPGGLAGEGVGPVEGLEGLGIALFHEEQSGVGLVEARGVRAGPEGGLDAAVGPREVAAAGGDLNRELDGVHVVGLGLQRHVQERNRPVGAAGLDGQRRVGDQGRDVLRLLEAQGAQVPRELRGWRVLGLQQLIELLVRGGALVEGRGHAAREEGAEREAREERREGGGRSRHRYGPDQGCPVRAEPARRTNSATAGPKVHTKTPGRKQMTRGKASLVGRT